MFTSYSVVANLLLRRVTSLPQSFVRYVDRSNRQDEDKWLNANQNPQTEFPEENAASNDEAPLLVTITRAKHKLNTDGGK